MKVVHDKITHEASFTLFSLLVHGSKSIKSTEIIVRAEPKFIEDRGRFDLHMSK